ncbi:MAG: cell division protein FtsQ/DivIB [Alphaproteobacteria bacterium]|nr:cell division protein FtsQ/DivIB [Alphaproteobacteria bacterium]
MSPSNRIYMPVLWPYRLIGNLLLLVGIGLLTFGIITIRHNLVGQHIDSLMEGVYKNMASSGWGLDDITLEGREKTSLTDINELINLKRGDNILEINLEDLKSKILTLPWVKNVNISRTYSPNVIHIFLQEKIVKSIWQYQNNFYPIDEDGKIIETEYVPQKGLLQLVGEDAPEHINELLNIMERDALFSRVKAARYVSKRRWDLIFDDVENGIIVKLPQENVEEAWKKLIKLDKTKGILKRKLTFIDLRLKNKVVVKISNED